MNALSRAICPKVIQVCALRKILRSTSNSAQTFGFQLGCPGPQLVILFIIDLKSNFFFQASQEVFWKRTDFIVLLVAELGKLEFRVQEKPTTLYDETHQRFCAMEQDFHRNFFFNFTLFFAFSSGLFEWITLIWVWFERFLLPNTS